MKKKTTKTQEAKKILKKKFKVNTKIVFTEDGEVRSIQNNCILLRSAFVVSLKTKILSICIKRYSFQKCVVSISGLSFAKLFSFHLEFNSTGKKRNAEHWPLVTFVCERSLYESCYWLYRKNCTSFLPIVFNFRWNQESVSVLQKCKTLFL